MSIPDVRLHMAFGQRADDAHLYIDELTLGEVVDLLTTHREGPKDGRYFVPAKFREAYRDKDNVAAWSGCCIDIDRNTSREEIEHKLPGFAWIAHSTYKPGRARVFVPYNQPVPTPTHQKIAAKLNRIIGAVDDCNEKRLQFFYLPACPKGAARWGFHTLDTAPLLHPLQFLDTAPDSAPAGNLAGLSLPAPPRVGAYPDWLAQLLSGEDLHGNALAVTGSMVFRGIDKETIFATFSAMRAELERARGSQRVNELFAGELERMIDGAITNKAQKDAQGNFPPEGQTFDLSTFSLSGQSAAMELNMLADKYILGRLAILGQSTAIYAKPNAGKTLLTLWLLIQSIESGELNGEDVYYVNADDNHKGLTQKLKIAEKHGFHMLAPGYNDFKPQLLGAYLGALVKQDSASGKVLILDTVKKFTDLMDKKRGSDFGEVVRQFVSHGGSVVMLAHVNKHRNEEGKVVHAGTADLVDDADCAYTLDTVEQDPGTGDRTVKFENFKSRGDVALEAVYKYNASQGVNYFDRLDSVQSVSDAEREQAEARRAARAKAEKNRDALEAIKECLREGITLQSELVAAAAERSGIGKVKIHRVLKEHTGTDEMLAQHWTVEVRENNAHHYKPNFVFGLSLGPPPLKTIKPIKPENPIAGAC